MRSREDPVRAARGEAGPVILVPVDVDDGLGKRFRSFLRHVVTDAVQDPVRILAGELARVAFAVPGWTVEVAGDGDGRNGDDGALEEFLLQLVILRLAIGQSLALAIVVDDDIVVIR